MSLGDDPNRTVVNRQWKNIYIYKSNLEKQKEITTNMYFTKCLAEILQEMNFRGIMIHDENAFTHSVRIADEFLETS